MFTIMPKTQLKPVVLHKSDSLKMVNYPVLKSVQRVTFYNS